MSLARLKFSIALCVIWFILTAELTSGYFSAQVDTNNDGKNCFCELKGSINDCSCTIDTVDHFNNVRIYPRLKSLLVSDFFRFYKVNLKQKCPFWTDNSKCAMKFCQVESCEEKDVPAGIKGYQESPAHKYLSTSQDDDCNHNIGAEQDLNSELSYLNTSLSAKAHEEFQKWAAHDAAEEDFCILDDLQNGAEYVDLLLNPEKYTGYKGEAAQRVWRSIYLENCFGIRLNNSSTKSIFDIIPPLDQMHNVCLEQRAFYRLISGLHTSINIHLSANYLLSESKDFMAPAGIWGHNEKEFMRRFSPETTNQQGPHWLKNLYFIYLIELRAIAKAAPYLRKEAFYTGSQEEDYEVKLAVNDLLNVAESFPSHFNEKALFSNGFASIKLKTVFREKFRNISRIMDCVGCDKCRLWGKLQTQGLGTALKILYSDKFDLAAANGIFNSFVEQNTIFRLTRQEVVSLFNAFGRLSNSIYELENFRKTIR